MKTCDLNMPRSEISSLIDEWVFSQRDRLMLKRRMLDGVCYEELAEEFNLSVQRTKSIVYAQQQVLRMHM